MIDEFNDAPNIEAPSKKVGRPCKSDPVRVPYDELDQILVYGEEVTYGDGKNKTTRYPTYRELARRYGVNNSVISRYARAHNVKRRREHALARIMVESDKKLVELRATAVALTKDDELRIIDSYLSSFEKALAEERVRCDNPGDFNTMIRLKQFIQGGADSRQEIHAALSLENIQERHRRMMKTVKDSSCAERGRLDDRMLTQSKNDSDSTGVLPPRTSFSQEDSKSSADILLAQHCTEPDCYQPAARCGAVSEAAVENWGQDTDPNKSGQQNENVAPCGCQVCQQTEWESNE